MCGFSHLTMRFVLATGPSRKLLYGTGTVLYAIGHEGIWPHFLLFLQYLLK